MSQHTLGFKIVEREGTRVVMHGREARPATAEELELWDLINPDPSQNTLWESLSAQMSKMELPLTLAWWIFYRLGDALPAEVDPTWLRGVIIEFQKEPQALTVARLKAEFPGDFREGGR